jgi:hypothetical protein
MREVTFCVKAQMKHIVCVGCKVAIYVPRFARCTQHTNEWGD